MPSKATHITGVAIGYDQGQLQKSSVSKELLYCHTTHPHPRQPLSTSGLERGMLLGDEVSYLRW